MVEVCIIEETIVVSIIIEDEDDSFVDDTTLTEDIVDFGDVITEDDDVMLTLEVESGDGLVVVAEDSVTKLPLLVMSVITNNCKRNNS